MPESPFSSDAARQPVPAEWTGPGLVDLQLNGYAGVDFNGPVESLTPEVFHRVRGGPDSAMGSWRRCRP